jgi:hypothetical protein
MSSEMFRLFEQVAYEEDDLARIHLITLLKRSNASIRMIRALEMMPEMEVLHEIWDDLPDYESLIEGYAWIGANDITQKIHMVTIEPVDMSIRVNIPGYIPYMQHKSLCGFGHNPGWILNPNAPRLNKKEEFSPCKQCLRAAKKRAREMKR